ncbi:MAG TPA: class I SAM-dependent methyltransferase [Vicinamibacteria bacterium]|nr:class I SAM-dependent methyltransferase [Vicinamibacteria bacterium]
MELISRRLKYTTIADAIEFLVRNTPILDGHDAPPAWINYAGAGDFTELGDRMVRLLEERAGLREGEFVLDIGCGIARNALALARRFKTLPYSGFDVVRFGITWCRKRFRDRPEFEFRHADIHNGFYNPRGRIRAIDYRFEYPDATFALAFAASVITHMPYGEVQHYLAETARVLKPGGRAYVTAFILDDHARASIARGVAEFRFAQPINHAFTEVPEEPEVAVAFDPGVFERAVVDAGMSVERFYPGNWRGDPPAEDGQDGYLLRRPA